MSILPGWFPFMDGSLQSISEFDNATSLAETITAPSGIIAGDLMVFMNRGVNSTGVPSAVVPSGFTSIVDTDNGSNIRQIVSYKIADGTEGGTSLTGMSADSKRGLLYVFRGNVPVSSVNASTPNEEITQNNPASQSVTASGGTAPLIVFGCYAVESGSVDPRTFSPTKDGELNITGVAYFAYRIDNLIGQDTTIDMDDEGNSNTLQSFYLEVS